MKLDTNSAKKADIGKLPRLRQGVITVAREPIYTIEKFTFKITGLTPLLMNNPASMAAGLPRIPKPEVEAKAKLYIRSTGELFLPAAQFRNALLYGSKGKKIGKVGAPGVMAANVQVPLDCEECILTDTDGIPLTEASYTIDVRTAVVQGNRIFRARPRLDNWSTIVVFGINVALVDVGVVAEFLDIGGKMSGAGDFRPSCKGQFGQYAAELIVD